MDLRIEEHALRSVIEPLATSMSFKIVSLDTAVVKRTLKVHLVVYRDGGVDTDSLAELHKLLGPRLDARLEGQDFSLEISSPGTTRKIKYGNEFAIFTGNGIRVLLTDSNDWISGVISSSDGSTLKIKTGEQELSVRIKDIHKARLD